MTLSTEIGGSMVLSATNIRASTRSLRWRWFRGPQGAAPVSRDERASRVSTAPEFRVFGQRRLRGPA